jgi:hypothetical protein
MCLKRCLLTHLSHQANDILEKAQCLIFCHVAAKAGRVKPVFPGLCIAMIFVNQAPFRARIFAAPNK